MIHIDYCPAKWNVAESALPNIKTLSKLVGLVFIYQRCHLSLEDRHCLGGALQFKCFAQTLAKIVGQGWRHSIPYLSVLIVHIAIEMEAVWEALQDTAAQYEYKQQMIDMLSVLKCSCF